MAEETQAPEGKSLAEEKLEFARQMLEGAVNGGNPDDVARYLDALNMVYDVSAVPNNALIQADLLRSVYAQPKIEENLIKVAQDNNNEQQETAQRALQELEDARAKEGMGKEKAEAQPERTSEKEPMKISGGDNIPITNSFGRNLTPSATPSQGPIQNQGMSGPK